MKHGWAITAPGGAIEEVYLHQTKRRSIEGYLILHDCFSSLAKSRKSRRKWRELYRAGYRCVPVEIRVVVPGESTLAANISFSRN